MRQNEEKSHKELADIWLHRHTEKEPSPLIVNIDLFSKESNSIFGLEKRDLIIAGSIGGAITGSGIDLMVGGSSFLMGSALGPLAGGAGAIFGFVKLAKVEILGRKIGNQTLNIGPVTDSNFPFILLRRALYYTKEVANRPPCRPKKDKYKK